MIRNVPGVNHGESHVNSVNSTTSISRFTTVTNTDTQLVSLTYCQANSIGSRLLLPDVDRALPLLLLCLDGHFALSNMDGSFKHDYTSGYVGYWQPGELSHDYVVELDGDSVSLVIIALKSRLVSKWAFTSEFGFAIWCSSYGEDPRPRVPYRVNDNLVETMRGQLSRLAGPEEDAIDDVLNRLGSEINRAEKYRDLYCPMERLMPDITVPGDFLFHAALQRIQDSSNCLLPEHEPFFYLEVPEERINKRNEAAFAAFKGWVARIVKLNIVENLPNVLYHYPSPRKPMGGDSDVLAQSHRWYAWWLHENVRFSGPWAYENTPLRLKEERVNRILRLLIKQPRQTPENFFVLHDDYCYGPWQDFVGDARGSAKSLLQLLFFLQKYPRAIPWFIDNTVLKMWYINEDFEVEDAVYEGVKNIPMVIFFLREQSVKEKVLLWPFEKNVLCWESRVEECDRWLIEQRIFHAARTMLIYCHGLGYDPEAVIRKTMREFEVRFDYELLMEQYRRDLESRQFGSSLFIA